MLCELAMRAHVRRIVMIAGDRDEPAGEFRSAIQVIETGLLPGRGIEEIGIAGYPDGHPRITTGRTIARLPPRSKRQRRRD